MQLKGIYSNKPFWVKCFILASLNFFGLILWINIAWITGVDNNEINSFRISQLLFSLFGLIMPALVSAHLFKVEDTNYLQTNKVPTSFIILLAIFAVIIIQPFVNLITVWNEQITFPETLFALESKLREMEELATNLTMQFLENSSINNLFINLFLLALLPAISEELFFRATLQKVIGEKLGHHMAIWFVAIIFSAYHLQFFGFFPRIILGAFLGYLFLWSKSIYLPMIAHFINNATLIVFYFLHARKIINFDIDSIGVADQWWLSVISIACLTPILYLMNRKYLDSKTDSSLNL